MLQRNLILFLAVVVTAAIYAESAMAFHNPSTGRFMQRDPLGTALSPSFDSSFRQQPSAQIRQYSNGLNLYQYVMSQPLSGLDPTGLEVCYCGPDITQSLQNVLNKIDSDWATWQSHTRKAKCGEDSKSFWLGIRWGGAWSGGGWDLKPLNSGTLREPGCGTGERCKQTAWVNGSCHHQREINYVFWGKINALCGASKSGMHAFTGAWKAVRYAKINLGAHSWADAGFDGNTNVVTSSLQFRDCLDCGKSSTATITYTWSN